MKGGHIFSVLINESPSHKSSLVEPLWAMHSAANSERPTYIETLHPIQDKAQTIH